MNFSLSKGQDYSASGFGRFIRQLHSNENSVWISFRETEFETFTSRAESIDLYYATGAGEVVEFQCRILTRTWATV